MSRINAYLCDYCLTIKHEDEISGISPVRDMFDALESNKACSPEKAEVHFCLECYRQHVLNATVNMNGRNRDEDLYQKTLKEMTYAFKQGVLYKHKESLKKKRK